MNERRVRFVTAVFFIFFLVLIVRVLILSLEGEDRTSFPLEMLSLYPARGIIYDARGIPVVSNTQKFYYYFDTNIFKKVLKLDRVDSDVVYSQLEDYFDVSRDYIEERLDSTSFIRIGSSEFKPIKLETPLYHFVSQDAVSQRNILYPYLEQVIGSVDSFGGGVNGVEKAFNNVLSPKKKGQVDFEKLGVYNRLGAITNIEQPENGGNISLSLDLRYQMILYNALEKAKRENDADSCLGLIMETHSGKIKAMYSTLGWNAPVMGVYEPGSAMKPFTFAMALKYSQLDMNEEFTCTGKIKPFSDLPTVIGDTHVHGRIDTTQALANSCNVATVEIALDFLKNMGDWTFYNELRELGFGKKTGIELPREVSGILHPPDSWNRLTGIQMAMGQGIAVTGIQLTAAMNTIANDGVYISPTLLAEDGKTETHRVYQEDVAKKLKAMMVETVESGSGKKAAVKGISIAAKTGTAQKAFAGRGYVQGRYVSSLVGFFPADDPAYTMLISIDEPKGEYYYGGDVAAPVFREVTGEIVKIITAPKKRSPDKIMVTGWKIPDFRNYTKKDVTDILNTVGLASSKVIVEGDGIVVEQKPEPGTPIEDVETIYLKLETTEGDE